MKVDARILDILHHIWACADHQHHQMVLENFLIPSFPDQTSHREKQMRKKEANTNKKFGYIVVSI